MRTSKRTLILDSIVEIIEESGMSDVTYENVATRSGMSKSGLIYHFPSRDDMIRSVHEYMAQRWEQELIDAAGGPAEEVSQANRLRANLEVSINTATRAELLMAIDSSSDPELREIWAKHLRRWNPPADDIATDPDACAAFLVQMISDGIWANDYINGFSLSPQQRKALVEAAQRLIPESE
nr:TetR/AcrR family transcriptional regulator [Corynebacterium lactis]